MSSLKVDLKILNFVGDGSGFFVPMFVITFVPADRRKLI
jgi:hypothetical protein